MWAFLHKKGMTIEKKRIFSQLSDTPLIIRRPSSSRHTEGERLLLGSYINDIQKPATMCSKADHNVFKALSTRAKRLVRLRSHDQFEASTLQQLRGREAERVQRTAVERRLLHIHVAA